MKFAIVFLCLLFVSQVRSGCKDIKRELDALKKKIAGNRVAYCSAGLKNGKIKNSQLTSSSHWSAHYIAGEGRLDKPPISGNSGGAWVPNAARRRAGEWMQVDFKKPTRVYGVVTQGRQAYNEWVTGYKILYGNTTDNLQTFRAGCTTYDAIFPGNKDRNSHVSHDFNPSIFARYFRLEVFSYSGAVSLRMDYLIC